MQLLGVMFTKDLQKKINDIPVIIAESMTQALGHIQLFFDSNKQSVVFQNEFS